LGLEQRTALEQLLFFNTNQHRVRTGILESIDTYGVPEIHEEGASLRVRVGDIVGVQSLFAVSTCGHLLGVAVFVRSTHERFAVLHLGVETHRFAVPQLSTRVLLKLMHEIRGAARRTQGVERIDLVYKHHSQVRPNG